MRVSICIFLLRLTFGGISFSECINNKLWFWECQQSKNIFLEQNLENISDPIKTSYINIGNMNFDDPKECDKDFCFKETHVTISIKKVWKPMSMIINDEKLKSRDFAKNFPNIVESKLLDNSSPVYDRYILQKVLYERWLLWTKPTGKIWYLTEQAIMKLQCIKNIKEYDKNNWIFIIWKQTISEINKIKDNMKDNNYLKNTRVPNIDLSKCWRDFDNRNEWLEKLLTNPPSWADNNYENAISPNYKVKVEWDINIKQTK